jgi:hypothetical protein
VHQRCSAGIYFTNPNEHLQVDSPLRPPLSSPLPPLFTLQYYFGSSGFSQTVLLPIGSLHFLLIFAYLVYSVYLVYFSIFSLFSLFSIFLTQLVNPSIRYTP